VYLGAVADLVTLIQLVGKVKTLNPKHEAYPRTQQAVLRQDIHFDESSTLLLEMHYPLTGHCTALSRYASVGCLILQTIDDVLAHALC
jgi:hypothetical protein